MVPARSYLLSTCALLLMACGSSGSTVDAGGGGGGDVPVDVPVVVDDGTPMRVTCTNNFGGALSSTFGRLDGYLVAIVPAGANGCNGDDDHVHLQVKMNGAIYDVAVNVGTKGASDAGTATTQVWLGAPWEEGWHTGTGMNYLALDLHSTDMQPKPSSQNATELTQSLATVNHISIFGTAYGPDGIHLVHRNYNGRDGLIVTQPLSAPQTARAFAFSDQTF